MIPTITELMKDPYAAVRWVAFDSLRRDKDFAATKFEFDDREEARNRSVQGIVSQWMSRQPTIPGDASTWSRLLIDVKGMPDIKRIQELLSRRDQRMVAGVE